MRCHFENQFFWLLIADSKITLCERIELFVSFLVTHTLFFYTWDRKCRQVTNVLSSRNDSLQSWKLCRNFQIFLHPLILHTVFKIQLVQRNFLSFLNDIDFLIGGVPSHEAVTSKSWHSVVKEILSMEPKLCCRIETKWVVSPYYKHLQ